MSTPASTPIAGNFYAFSGTFVSQDLSCDDFLAKVHGLIADWTAYPHLNLYALTVCGPTANAKSSTDFIYGFDAWVPAAVPEDQAFIKAHQGVAFQGRALDFYAVTSIDVNTELGLDQLSGTALTAVHETSFASTFSGTDTWYPDYSGRVKLIQQTNEKAFLDYVDDKCGASEMSAFKQALGSANFVQFGDFFTLHLADGRQVDFWLGFGSSRNCGTQPCFTEMR
jgi:hypothetical protein